MPAWGVKKGIDRVRTELAFAEEKKGRGRGDKEKKVSLLLCERRKQIFQHTQEWRVKAASPAATF